MRSSLLLVVSLLAAPAAAGATPFDLAPLPEAPAQVIPVILGCHLVGPLVVCGSGEDNGQGEGLLGRRRQKAVVEPKSHAYAPKSTSSKKHHTTKSTGTAPVPATAGTPVPATAGTPVPATSSIPALATAPAAAGTTAPAVPHTCPPGDIVLATPNAAGSFCQAVSTGTATIAPVTSTAPSGVTAPPAASAPADAPSSQAQTATAPMSQPTAATGAWCCTANATLNGQTAPAQQACGADQNTAMNSLVNASMAQKLTLGAISCTGQ